MSTWERNELRMKIADKLMAMAKDREEAEDLADLAVRAFVQVGSVVETVETTTLGSAQETALRQRFVVARLTVGEPEHLIRERQQEWRAR